MLGVVVFVVSSCLCRFNTGNVVRLSTVSIKSVRGWLEKMFWKMTRIVNWWKTVLFVCVLALAVDPLFFFIPVIDSHKFCFTLDKKLGVAVCVLRTLIDVFYVIHFIFHFITERIAPRSRASLRGNSKPIRKRLFFFYFSVDIVSVLPIPQVCLCYVLSSLALVFNDIRLTD